MEHVLAELLSHGGTVGVVVGAAVIAVAAVVVFDVVEKIRTGWNLDLSPIRVVD